MDYDELFPGRFLKSGEFKGRDVTLTIRTIRTEELPQDKGGTKVKGIIGFDGTKKELVLNRTNGECLKAIFGRDTDEWIGKKVTFYPAPHTDSFTGEVGTAIRVRGSPELEKDTSIQVRLARKKPINMTMKRTAKKAAPAAKAEPEPEAEDEGLPPEDADGEALPQ